MASIEELKNYFMYLVEAQSRVNGLVVKILGVVAAAPVPWQGEASAW